MTTAEIMAKFKDGVYTASPEIVRKFNKYPSRTLPMPEDIGDVALKFQSLSVSPTRLCEEDCDHCCNEGSRNLSMTTDIVDAFYDKNKISEIGHLSFVSGNTPLRGGLALYFVRQLIDRQIPLNTASVTINRQTYSQELVDAFLLLKKYTNLHQADIGMSNDEHHRPPRPGVVEQYTQYVKAGIFDPDVDTTSLNEISNLAPVGNAVNLLMKTMTKERALQRRAEFLADEISEIEPVTERSGWDHDNDGFYTFLSMPKRVTLEANGGMHFISMAENWFKDQHILYHVFAAESFASALYRQGLVKKMQLPPSPFAIHYLPEDGDDD